MSRRHFAVLPFQLSRAAFALALVAASLVASAAEPISFHAARAIPAPSGPGPVAIADFDGDGRSDIAILGFQPSIGRYGIHVRLGDGIGGFALAQHIQEADVRAIAAADFSGDGRVDLAVTIERAFDPRVLFLAGDGAGTFSPWLDFPAAGSIPLAVVVADFDENGSPDAAVACHAGLASGTIRVFLSDGAGGISTAAPIDSGVGPSALGAADFDEDGHVDLALTKSSGGVRGAVFPGRGDGEFDAPIPVSMTHRATSLHVTDVDRDGHADVIAATIANSPALRGGLVVLRGDGSGSLDETQSLEISNGTEALSVADWSEDGYPDAVFRHAANPFGVAFLRNDRAGNLVVDHVDPRFAGGGDDTAQFAADVDGDGHVDLGLPGDRRFSLLLGLGGGRFDTGAETLADLRPIAVVPADMDGDGRLDVAMTARREGVDHVAILLGDGAGALAKSSEVPIDVPLHSAQDAVVHDFDGDGAPDMALAHSLDPGVLSFHRGDGEGAFLGTAVFVPTGAPQPRFLSAADFDEDGYLDVAVARWEPAPASDVRIYGGDGSLGFAEVFQFAPPLGPFTDVAAADVDGDGDADVLVSAEGSAWSLLGDGSGGFAIVGPSSTPSRSSLATLADFTEDGTLDLAVATDSAFANGVSILVGDGAGGFSFHDSAGAGLVVLASLHAVDFDLDGHVDVLAEVNDIAQYQDASRVAVIPGLGLGSLGEPIEFVSSGGSNSAVPGDFDGDGRPEFAGFEFYEGRISVALDSTFDLDDARRGNVNAGAGAIVDVLFVNGSAGVGPERKILLARGEPLTIFMAAPPSDPDGPAVFAMYKWLVAPTNATVEALPLGLGLSCLAPPLVPFGRPQPKHVWNNAGRQGKLGVPTHPSVPAPSVVFTLPAGLDRSVTWILQGFIRDRDALNGRGATTNAVRLEVP